jgi:hypothetical protein
MPSKPTEQRLFASIERLPNILGSHLHQQSSSSTQSKNAESIGGLISRLANASRSAAAPRRAARLAKDDSTACATTEYAESSDVQRGSSDNYTCVDPSLFVACSLTACSLQVVLGLRRGDARRIRPRIRDGLPPQLLHVLRAPASSHACSRH